MRQEDGQGERIRIGLLVSHPDDDFDREVCEGAMECARRMDADLVIFPGRYINAVYADRERTGFEYQYNTLFDIPSHGEFDVLLVLMGTMAGHLGDEECEELLRRYDGTPVITLARPVGNTPCVRMDNRTGMAETIRHLITKHRCQRIGFFSGPLTNPDARERLEVYRSVLAENGIPFDENRVGYGDFTRYCADSVGELLDRCPDLEALVFANDGMALGGYEAMESRGIRPGRDLAVVGFDDDPVAQEMVPHLTTAKADRNDLGHAAVEEAVRLVTEGRTEGRVIHSETVIRNSCGCHGIPRLDQFMEAGGEGARERAGMAFDFLMARCRDERILKELKRNYNTLIVALLGLTEEGRIRDSAYRSRILMLTDRLTTPAFFRYTTPEEIYTTLEYSYKSIWPELTDPADSRLLGETFMRIYWIVADKNVAAKQDELDDEYLMNWQTNAIAGDMLVFDIDDDRRYLSVMDKLQRLKMDSGYLFVYENPAVNRPGDAWDMPENLYLKAYHNRSGAILLPRDHQRISRENLMVHPCLPRERQTSMMVLPLFSKEEQYGLLMCEVMPGHFHYMQSAAIQLCSALRTLSLMKQQHETQRELRSTLIRLRENNELLSGLSKTDELTGCLNRRGFYEKMRERMSERAAGTAAVMIFADLDGLKRINDLFGHAEGDSALCAAARIMRDTLGPGAVIGRIGGDEFACCDVSAGVEEAEVLVRRMEKAIAAYNASEGANKPYPVHFSVGVHPFRCGDTVDIGELLGHADALLYERKKHKPDAIG